MTRQPLVAKRAEELLGSSVVATAPVAGGDISSHPAAAQRRHHRADEDRPHAPEGFFERRGRRTALAGRGRRGRPPEVLGVDDECLILRWVEPGKSHGRRGRRLRPGAGRDPRGRRPGVRRWTRTGSSAGCPLPQPAAPTRGRSSTPTRRVLPYLKLARDRGRSPPRTTPTPIEAVVGRLPEPAARGAAVPAARRPLERQRALGPRRRVARVIDPAAYGGHREADLAMLALFGLPHLPRVMDGVRRGRAARPTAGRSGSRCTSCSRCSCTRACSAAATAPARPTIAARFVVTLLGPMAQDRDSRGRWLSLDGWHEWRRDLRPSRAQAPRPRRRRRPGRARVAAAVAGVQRVRRRAWPPTAPRRWPASRRSHPDVVVMDVMMPRLDGLEATRALRKAGNDVPILVLTARDAVGDRVEGLDAGADDYLTKPFALAGAAGPAARAAAPGRAARGRRRRER